MEYRIEVLNEEIEIVGKKRKVATQEAFQAVPKLWEEATQNGFMEKLIGMSWEQAQCQLEGILGVCGNQSIIKDEEFEYFMGCRYEGEIDEELEKIVLPMSTWAVFPNVDEAWKRVFMEWLPSSDYQLANLPCIENYLPPNKVPSSELWVPVIPK